MPRCSVIVVQESAMACWFSESIDSRRTLASSSASAAFFTLNVDWWTLYSASEEL